VGLTFACFAEMANAETKETYSSFRDEEENQIFAIKKVNELTISQTIPSPCQAEVDLQILCRQYEREDTSPFILTL